MSARILGAVAAAALVLHALAVAAQVPGAPFCDPATVYNENPSPDDTGPVERMHPLLSRARYADAVREERWEFVLRALRDDALQAFVAAGVSAADQKTFQDEIEATAAAAQALPPGGDPGRAAHIANAVRTIRFSPIPLGATYMLFRPPSPASIDVGALPAEQARALCWSAFSVNQVLFRLGLGIQPAALARLARLNTSWANYRTYGYTRQPLELFLFRGQSVHDTLPRRAQWLLGHLSLGAEVRWRDSLTSVATSVVEVAGRLWYWRDYTQYSGVSAIVGVPSGRRPGAGAMVHVARSLRGGVLVRREDRKWRPAVVVSTDLYGLLERSKRSVDLGTALARGRVLLGVPAEK